jgi:hypothetical protein
MNKWLVEYTGGSLQVAGVCLYRPLTIDSAFAFQVTCSVNLEEIACAIEKIQVMCKDRDQYWKTCQIETTGGIIVNKVTTTSCSITVNNYRVLFAGDIRRLNGLPRALRKAEMKLNKGVDNE